MKALEPAWGQICCQAHGVSVPAQYRHKHGSWTTKKNRDIGSMRSHFLTAAIDASHDGFPFELLKVRIQCILIQL